ncbi:MAG TPA: nucleotide exchange factor GrpE [Balneolales bacterium]|nr:nucleotide exchange factor GrpE [Balneolales bacterium]
MEKKESGKKDTVKVDTFQKSDNDNSNKEEKLKDLMEQPDTEGQSVGESAEEQAFEESLKEKDQEIETLARDLADTKDRLLRKVAEFENMKKRVSRERVQLFDDAKIEALREFLPINDDLRRTLEAADKTALDDKFLEGVHMVADKFSQVLQKYGVEPINQVNVPFDVNLHDAMIKQPAPDNDVESNTVLQVLEPGYKINDRIIRHAKVIVSE